MYLYLERKDHIHLLFLFDKNEQEDLDPAYARSFGSWSNASSRREKTMSKKTKPTLFDDLRDSLQPRSVGGMTEAQRLEHAPQAVIQVIAKHDHSDHVKQ